MNGNYRPQKQPPPIPNDTRDEFQTVDLSSHDPSTPLGLLLAPETSTDNIPPSPSSSSDTVIVAGWDRIEHNKLGIIQRSGLVRLGDVLVAMNGVNVRNMKFRQVMDLLKSLMVRGDDERGLLMSLTFSPPGRVGNVDASAASSPSGMCNRRRRYTFHSSILRARIRKEDEEPDHDESGNANTDKAKTIAEYEVSCRLLILGGFGSLTRSATGQDKRWTVWKRFSEFKLLDEHLRDAYGWQLNALEGKSSTFPSSRPLSAWFSSVSPAFVEKRREELDKYWQSVLMIEEMTDFAHPHRYSRDLATFFNVENYLNSTAAAQLNTNTVTADSSDALSPPQVNGNAAKEDRHVEEDHRNRSFSSDVENNDQINNSARTDCCRMYIPAKSIFQRHLPGMHPVRILIPGGE